MNKINDVKTRKNIKYIDSAIERQIRHWKSICRNQQPTQQTNLTRNTARKTKNTKQIYK